ncbi:hypothetical protein FHS83_000194 [Rhizomicrobium palustre]|uniref:DUF1993 domain-containing protein n=1 Tax=Rhizomicrobium palustre TaxID=189966 RepID=A0A846MU51_9PROT|nr:DUF1993 domain-containing protein [Rhizomicrobium palustre]NIK86876.1 hypothetical protein [Rhizomicrobium palustre]
MAISMYRASIPVFVQFLTNLSAILGKAAQHAEAKKIDPSVFTTGRLSPDMFPLTRQVQIACDSAKGVAARLSGSEVPSFPDTETSFPELQARIAKTLEYIQSVEPASIEGSDDKTITLKAGQRELTFTGEAYLTTFALPNFYFHITATYAILRHMGVELGKLDYLGGK